MFLKLLKDYFKLLIKTAFFFGSFGNLDQHGSNLLNTDAGTLVMYLWEQDLARNSLFIHDLEHLPNRVKEHNARRVKCRSNANGSDHHADLIEQSSDIPWEDRQTAIDKVRPDLVKYIAKNSARCSHNKKEIHLCLKSF